MHMYYLVNDLRFINEKNKWKIHEMDVAKICVQQKLALQDCTKTFLTFFSQRFWQHSEKHLKNEFWSLHYKVTQTSASKDFIITFPTYFATTFFATSSKTFPTYFWRIFCNIFQRDLIQTLK